MKLRKTQMANRTVTEAERDCAGCRDKVWVPTRGPLARREPMCVECLMRQAGMKEAP